MRTKADHGPRLLQGALTLPLPKGWRVLASGPAWAEIDTGERGATITLRVDRYEDPQAIKPGPLRVHHAGRGKPLQRSALGPKPRLRTAGRIDDEYGLRFRSSSAGDQMVHYHLCFPEERRFDAAFQATANRLWLNFLDGRFLEAG